VLFKATKDDTVSIEKLTVESKRELEQMITEQLPSIERDMSVVCADVPINDRATLDILCHDENGQLAIIQISTGEDDTMLLQGLQSMDYVDKFKSFLKATYNKHKIDDREKPRLILIAPSFSNAVRNAVESMKGMRIDLYEWEYLKLGDQKLLHFQRLFGPKTPERPRETREPEKKHEQKPKRKDELTTENEDQAKETETPQNTEQTAQQPPEPGFRKPEEGTEKRRKFF
jgi:hypothetical protein